MPTFLPILTLASLGGIIPCVLWLVFWLREDNVNPEPMWIIIACFVAGMIATIAVYPFEYLVVIFFKANSGISIFLWALTEESFKFFACYLVAIRSKFYDEPIDAVIYMITVALGFAALENVLFLINPISGGDPLSGLITGNLRFIGANLLHIISSGTLGTFMAFAFYKKIWGKEELFFVGFVCAVALHTIFNFFILHSTKNTESGFLTFVVVWSLIIILIVILEKIKTIKKENQVLQ